MCDVGFPDEIYAMMWSKLVIQVLFVQGQGWLGWCMW